MTISGAVRSDRPTRADAESFVTGLNVSAAERATVVRCLGEFPSDCKSRGMFFEGVLENVRQRRSDARAKELLGECGIEYRIQNFGQYPHRDFYKLFYRSARLLHPELDFASGLERVAEDFYPLMFAKSLAGKTMAVLMGKDPASVLARFVDAYGIAVTGNEHAFERGDDRAHTWRCRVEPCDLYPRTFQGICRGMVRSITGVDPRVLVLEAKKGVTENRYVMRIEA